MYHFTEISLIITNYNRTYSLERLLSKLKNLQIEFGEIIVSDDCSSLVQIEHIKRIQSKYGFKLLESSVNKGLGNNINKAQDAVTLPYTIYIQEDFVPKPAFPDKLLKALNFMKNDDTIDFVRFYSYTKFPYLKPVADGFSEMIFFHWKIWQTYNKFYLYSDHPHLRKSSFSNKFGRYREGIKPERTEYCMMMQVLAAKPKAYYYNDYKDLLDQVNTLEEPSTIARNGWRENSSILISYIRHLYRYLRFNTELVFYKFNTN